MLKTKHKLPKITTIIDRVVTVGEVPKINEWMKETKPQLSSYAQRLTEKAETDLMIEWIKIFELDAVYSNDYEMPVICISGKAHDRAANSAGIVYVEAFAADGACSLEIRYTRDK